MSTRSNIAIIFSPENVASIYCHFDGYPDCNGRMLLDHYSDFDKVEELVTQGDISSLGSQVGSCTRGSNKKGLGARYYDSVAEAMEYMEEYFYVFDPTVDKWFYSDHRRPLVELTQTICDSKKY